MKSPRTFLIHFLGGFTAAELAANLKASADRLTREKDLAVQRASLETEARVLSQCSAMIQDLRAQLDLTRP